jgi:hypothetical protein
MRQKKKTCFSARGSPWKISSLSTHKRARQTKALLSAVYVTCRRFNELMRITGTRDKYDLIRQEVSGVKFTFFRICYCTVRDFRLPLRCR